MYTAGFSVFSDLFSDLCTFYLHAEGRTQFDTYVEGGTVLHNYAHVSPPQELCLAVFKEIVFATLRFDLIMRLRQAAALRVLVTAAPWHALHTWVPCCACQRWIILTSLSTAPSKPPPGPRGLV